MLGCYDMLTHELELELIYDVSNSAISDDLEWPSRSFIQPSQTFSNAFSYSSAAGDKTWKTRASRGPSATPEPWFLGEPFALCYVTVALSCLSVRLVYCGQTDGWIKIPLGMEVGLSPWDIVLDGDPALPTDKGTAAPHFSAHVYCDETAAYLSNYWALI